MGTEDAKLSNEKEDRSDTASDETKLCSESHENKDLTGRRLGGQHPSGFDVTDSPSSVANSPLSFEIAEEADGRSVPSGTSVEVGQKTQAESI